MARYAYRVIDAEGRAHSGRADAASAEDLERRLRHLGLSLVRCRPARTMPLLGRRSAVTRAELAQFCVQLSQLYRAGMGIVECLASLREGSERFALRQVAASLAASIESGSGLADAFASRADVFDPVFIALVRAGEQSGQLDAVLERLANDLRWRDDLARASWRALAYPGLVLSIVVGAVAGLLLFLVPPLASVFRSISPQLPLQTEMLVAVAAMFARGWPWVVGASVAAGIGLTAAAHLSERFRAALDSAGLRLPLLGALRMRFALARFAACLALLYRSGIGVLDGLRLCEDVVGPRELRAALRTARRAIATGRSLSQAFADTGLFPPLVMRMLQVGESTGNLDDALEHVSAHYSRSSREAVADLQAIIGPATTVILGGVIAAILAAVFMPLYEVIGKVRL